MAKSISNEYHGGPRVLVRFEVVIVVTLLSLSKNGTENTDGKRVWSLANCMVTNNDESFRHIPKFGRRRDFKIIKRSGRYRFYWRSKLLYFLMISKQGVNRPSKISESQVGWCLITELSTSFLWTFASCNCKILYPEGVVCCNGYRDLDGRSEYAR